MTDKSKGTAKAVNYTDEQAATLSSAFTAATTDAERADVVARFAAEFSKKPRSIVAKLSSMGVYIKPKREGKRGGETKADVVTDITKMVTMPENDADSLTKANATALKALRDALIDATEPDGEAD